MNSSPSKIECTISSVDIKAKNGLWSLFYYSLNSEKPHSPPAVTAEELPVILTSNTAVPSWKKTIIPVEYGQHLLLVLPTWHNVIYVLLSLWTILFVDHQTYGIGNIHSKICQQVSSCSQIWETKRWNSLPACQNPSITLSESFASNKGAENTEERVMVLSEFY